MHYDKNRRHGNPLFKRDTRNSKPCDVVKCPNKVVSNGLCQMHDMRARRHGDPNFINPKHIVDGKSQERNRARTAQWKRDNWGTYKYYLAARKQRVKTATPPWANLHAIEEFYRLCPKGYHVDHILPVNGKNVSGLHVIDNLQYLIAEENLRKSNKI